MLQSPNPRTIISIREEAEDLGRRRFQQQGNLYKQGTFWKLRWREDVDDDGATVRKWTRPIIIGPCDGPGKITERQARRMAWEEHLSKLAQNDVTPKSVITLEKFLPRWQDEHVALLSKSSQIFYRTQVKHLEPLEPLRLRDIGGSQVQQLVGSLVRGGYSSRTVQAVVRTLHVIFEHATRTECFTGRNPAELAKLPKLVPTKTLNTLSSEQLRLVLSSLKEPCRGVASVAALTGMNIAEICGLRWEHVNLSDAFRMIEGQAITPWTIAVREQWIHSRRGPLKTGSRRRNIPMADGLAVYLMDLAKRPEWNSPSDPVFVSSTGTPVNASNLYHRDLQPLAKKLKLALSWHVFRRTHTTLSDEVGMSVSDRMAGLGHSNSRMTMHYTRPDMERRRTAFEEIFGKVNEVVQ